MNTFDKMLEILIEKSGHSNLHIEEQVGISRSFLSKIIMKKRSPTLSAAIKLADFFDLSGQSRDEFLIAAEAARARRQSRAVPVLDALADKVSQAESESALLMKRTESAVVFACALVNNLTTGRQRTDLLRLLDSGLDGGPEHMTTAVAKIINRAAAKSPR